MLNRLLLPLSFIAVLSIACREEQDAAPVKKHHDANTLLIKGSESELKLVSFFADKFKETHPGITVRLSGEGSAVGLAALIRGEIDIANSSRQISSGEVKLAKVNHVDPVPVIIAVDAVAIITHPHVGIDSLSMTQLAKLFSGEIKNWKEIGGANLPVTVIGRNENSGTYHYLLDHLRINGFAPGATIKPGNAEILDAVSTREGALGYVNLGSIYDDEGKPRKNIWVAGLYVEGSIAYSPYRTEYVLNGEYPLTRPLYQYVDRNYNETVRDFIRMELSKEVQTSLQARGYFPIAAIHAEMNRKNGF